MNYVIYDSFGNKAGTTSYDNLSECNLNNHNDSNSCVPIGH